MFDLGESKFIRTNDGFNIKFTKHKRIKILHESGREQSEINILYRIGENRKKEKVKSIKAFTYNEENGSLIKKELDPTTIYDEKFNEYFRQKKFVFPDVQVGSILEYSYELITPYIFNLTDWEFQSNVPTEYSEYKVYMVPFYDYVNLIQGFDSLDVKYSEEGKKTYIDFGVEYKYFIHTFGLRDVEAFKDESFITSKSDYIKKIDFQLSKIYQPDGRIENRMTTWKEQRENLLDHYDFGKYLKRSKSIAKKIIESEIDISNHTDNDKIKLIVNYVKKSIEWNGYYGKYSTQSSRDLLKTKSGNSGDINLFLVSLLRAADLEADPMILSTRKHGKIKLVYPFHGATNYVIAYANGHGPLDATQRALSSALIPPHCINDYALLVNKNEKDKWFSINYSAPSVDQTTISMWVNPESLIAKSKILSKHTFFKAYNSRKSLGNNVEYIKDNLLESFQEVDSIRIDGYSNTSKHYTISYQAQAEIEQLGEYFTIDPFLNFPIDKNPLILEDRSYPVDFIYPYRNNYQVLIKFPTGYEPIKIPENLKIDNSIISLQIAYLYDEETLHVHASYEFKKSIYQPEEYQKLKKGIDRIVSGMNEKIYLSAIK